MRVSYLIRSISHWFTRVVYERDRWDHWLEETAEGMDFRIGWMFYLAMLGVSLSRGILWVLMMIAHLVSGFMLRQMEYNADLHQSRVAGCETFASTMRQLTLLAAAHDKSHQELAQLFEQQVLADDLPRLVKHNAESTPPKVLHAINKAAFEKTTRLTDTHPCSKDRITHTEKDGATGTFTSDRPASDLFQHYDALNKNVTWDLYRHILGTGVLQTDLKPLEVVLATRF